MNDWNSDMGKLNSVHEAVVWKCSHCRGLKCCALCCLSFSRRHTLWSTCLNTQWWNTWFPIIPLSTGQSLPPSLYASPSSEISPRAPSLQRRFLFICAQPEDFEPSDGFGKVPDCTSILWKDALLTNMLTFQRLLPGTSKDDITALLDGNWPQNSAPCDSTGGESALGSYIGSFLLEQTTNVLLSQGSQKPYFISKSWQTKVVCTRNSLQLSPSIREGFCFCCV